MTTAILENPETDPTLRDVANAVTDLTTAVTGLSTKITGLETTVTNLVVTVDDIQDVMKTGFASLEEYIDRKIDTLEDRMETGFHETNRRLGKVESTVEDMREDIQALMQAVDVDAKTIINHERRIVRLERVA